MDFLKQYYLISIDWIYFPGACPASPAAIPAGCGKSCRVPFRMAFGVDPNAARH
jgi:hypothetical protein